MLATCSYGAVLPCWHYLLTRAKILWISQLHSFGRVQWSNCYHAVSQRAVPSHWVCRVTSWWPGLTLDTWRCGTLAEGKEEEEILLVRTTVTISQNTGFACMKGKHLRPLRLTVHSLIPRPGNEAKQFSKRWWGGGGGGGWERGLRFC